MPLTIVLSAGQSRSPEKRGLEDAILQAAKQWPDVEVVSIPHLYDLVAEGPSVSRLRQINGPIVTISWMFERATHWVLDRLGVYGRLSPTELSEQEDEPSSDDDASEDSQTQQPPSAQSARLIYCIDLKANQDAPAVVAELRRLASSHATDVDAPPVSGKVAIPEVPPQELTLASLFMDSVSESDAPAVLSSDETSASSKNDADRFQRVDEHPTRRWYPVIDFSRCTNCMECIDFCLFGVYGVDAGERILVEQPDNCRKGCPACSRVCPANAIIFPQHKTPAIAGSISGDTSFKIDLSKLFGAPENDEDAKATAARERDEQLILAGRPAIGSSADDSSGIPTRTTAVIRSQWTAKSTNSQQLDSLLDELDQFDL